jgi:hypothetical protein
MRKHHYRNSSIVMDLAMVYYSCVHVVVFETIQIITHIIICMKGMIDGGEALLLESVCVDFAVHNHSRKNMLEMNRLDLEWQINDNQNRISSGGADGSPVRLRRRRHHRLQCANLERILGRHLASASGPHSWRRAGAPIGVPEVAGEVDGVPPRLQGAHTGTVVAATVPRGD